MGHTTNLSIYQTIWLPDSCLLAELTRRHIHVAHELKGLHAGAMKWQALRMHCKGQAFRPI